MRHLTTRHQGKCMSYYVKLLDINSFPKKNFTPVRRKIREGKVFGGKNLFPIIKSLSSINEIKNKIKSESTILGLDTRPEIS